MSKLRKKNPKGSLRRTAESMFPLLEDYQSSGLSQPAFCLKHDLPLPVFRYWLRRYRAEKTAARSEAPGFVSVELESPSVEGVLAEVIYPNGIRLVFKTPIGPDLLRSFLTKP